MFNRLHVPRFFHVDHLIACIRNTFIWAYEHSPVNFSTITGIHHPGLSRIPGNLFLGRAGFAMRENGLGLGDELNKAAEIASTDPRGMCYGSFGHLPFLLITRPSDIQQILIKNEKNCDRNETLITFTYLLGNKNLFGLPTGKEWEEKRRALKQWIFTPAALDKLTAPMQAIIKEFIAMCTTDGKIPSLEEFMIALAMDLFSRSILNTDALTTRAAPISTVFGCAMKSACNPANMFLLKIKKIAEYARLHTTKDLDKEKENLDKIITDLFITPNIDNLKSTPNFLQHYFLNESHLETAKANSLQDASSILLAGHETTSRLLQFTIMLLAKHPDILSKLRAEITQHKPKNGNWTGSDLTEMHYLRKILKESLRLFPPVPVIPRTATNDFVLANFNKIYNSADEYDQLMARRDVHQDLVIRKGTIIFIAAWQTHKLEAIYQHAEKFCPERFTTDSITQVNEEERYRFAFIPFGLGNRDCIGRFVALQEAQLTLIELVDKFNFSIHCNGTLFDTFMQGTLKHKGNVSIDFTPRDLRLEMETKPH